MSLKTTIPPSFSSENATRSYHKGGSYKVNLFRYKTTLKSPRSIRFPTVILSERSEREDPPRQRNNYPYKKVQIFLFFFYSKPSGIANMRSELR